MKFYFVFIALLLVASITAQDSVRLHRYVFASGGGFAHNGDLRLSYTIGQGGLVGTLTKDELSLTVGFQQKDPVDVLPPFIDENVFYSHVTLYPNPFQHSVTLTFEAEIAGEYDFEMYDYSGKIIYKEYDVPVSVGSSSKEIYLSEYPAGLYILTIILNSDKQNPVQQSIKLIKQ